MIAVVIQGAVNTILTFSLAHIFALLCLEQSAFQLDSRSLVNIWGLGRGWEWGGKVPLSYSSQAC